MHKYCKNDKILLNTFWIKYLDKTNLKFFAYDFNYDKKFIKLSFYDAQKKIALNSLLFIQLIKLTLSSHLKRSNSSNVFCLP